MIVNFKYLGFVSLYIVSLGIEAEIYSATSHLEQLKTTLEDVLEKIDAVNRKYDFQVLKNLLSQLKNEHNVANQDFPRYVGNPINALKLLKRLTVDLKTVETILAGKVTDFRNKALVYPTVADLDGAAESIAYLIDTFKLNVTQLADGILKVTRRRNGEIQVFSELFIPMTREDCLELGKAMYRTKKYKSGIMWLHEAIRKDNEGKDNGAGNIRDNILWHIRNGVKAQVLQDKRKSSEIDNMPDEVSIKYLEEQQDSIMTGILCRDEVMLSPGVSKSLKCYYGYGSHPYRRILGYKAEQLHLKPEITMMYDVLNDGDIRTLKKAALPELERAQVSSGTTNYTLDKRVCKTAPVRDCEIRKRVKQRISAITGMSLDESETLQVVNYGIGGMYEAHYDFWLDDSPVNIKGNRIATMLVYMSNVELGGSTVFLRLNVTVYPVKGAALFWRNLYPTGDGDFSTVHAACPVLRGNKWVLTQWINTRGQELNFPCPRRLF